MGFMKFARAGMFVCAGLGALAPMGAMAARHHTSGTVVFGSVAVAGENLLTVATPKGNSAVSYSGDTTFVPNSPQAATDGLQVGDAVWSTGTTSGDALAAIQITYDVAPFVLPNKPKSFSGRYKSSKATTVTIKAGKTRTFNTDGHTTYKQNGKTVTTPKYHKGYRLVIVANEFTDSSWLANTIGVWKA